MIFLGRRWLEENQIFSSSTEKKTKGKGTQTEQEVT